MTSASLAGQWFVLKLGGELATDVGKLSRSVGRAAKRLLERGARVLIVHGAGPQVTELSRRLSLEPRLVGGRRITDASTLEVVKMALAGQVSVDVARAFRLANVPVLATTGLSAGLVQAKKRPPRVISGAGPEPIDMGFVGDVVEVDVERLEALASMGLVPQLASLGGDEQGNVFNINADTFAADVAVAIRATRVVMVSNVPGVLEDKARPETRIPKLTSSEAKDRIGRGSIAGGMIPKVEECLSLLARGIQQVHIVGVEPEEAVAGEMESPGSFGTVFAAY